jgi:hypothetical protein
LIKERIDPYFIEGINVKPIFVKSNLSFYREENMGYITCVPKNFPLVNYLIINPTAKIILEFCNGKNIPKIIRDKLLTLYSDVAKDKITKVCI